MKTVEPCCTSSVSPLVVALSLLAACGSEDGRGRQVGGDPSSAARRDTRPPTAPTNVVATPASGWQVNLAWTASTDNVGVTGYFVERCQGAGCTTFAQIAAPTATSFSDTGLQPATSYSYRVRAT